MPVRRYRRDPRTVAERRADESVRRLFERGKLLEVGAVVEREAVDHVQRRYLARRETVAALGKELGVLRRAHGLTQDQVAEMHVFRAQHAYPIYTLHYEKHLAIALQAISAMQNMETAGRQGRFAYINTHIAMKMGYEAADRLLAKLGDANST